MVRHDPCFDALHRSLTPTKEMRERIQGAVGRARRVAQGNDAIANGLIGEPFTQGSYPMHTLTRPSGGDYDIDIGIPLSTAWWRQLSNDRGRGLDLLEEILEEDSHYQGKIERLTHCIRVDYAGDFHVDLVPLRAHQSTTLMQLPTDGGWLDTDPKEQVAWLAMQNGNAAGRLTRTIKFLKHVRNRHWDHLRIPSLMISCFAATHFPSNPNHSALAMKASRGDADFFDATVRQMASCAQEKGGDFSMPNPVRPGDELTRDMTIEDKLGFRDGLLNLREATMAARSEPDEGKSKEMWQTIFGDAFR